MRQFGVLCLTATLFVFGCENESAKKDQTDPVKTTEVKKEIEADPTDAPKKAELVVPERIHGMPVPEQVVGYFETKSQSRIVTEWDVKQVARFFSKNLVDYEVIEDGDTVQIVGLRDFMARAEARPRNRRSTQTSITYYPRKKSSKELAAFYGTGKKFKKGDDVKLRTPKGELLAPGAKWYEPYTPPPGSPLDKPYLKGNFGRPFGQWSNN